MWPEKNQALSKGKKQTKKFNRKTKSKHVWQLQDKVKTSTIKANTIPDKVKLAAKTFFKAVAVVERGRHSVWILLHSLRGQTSSQELGWGNFCVIHIHFTQRKSKLSPVFMARASFVMWNQAPWSYSSTLEQRLRDSTAVFLNDYIPKDGS